MPSYCRPRIHSEGEPSIFPLVALELTQRDGSCTILNCDDSNPFIGVVAPPTLIPTRFFLDACG